MNSTYYNYTSLNTYYSQSTQLTTNINQIQSLTSSLNTITSQFTTTTTKAITTMPFVLNSTSIFFSNSSLNWILVKSLFSSYTEDLTGCLVNCSNQGLCSVNSQNLLVCSCFGSYIGSSCQTDSRPCSASPCLNNGTCLESYDSTTQMYNYSCQCDSSHYGPNCEYMFDLCANWTCSGNGRCSLNSTFQPGCKCFQMYSGDYCEIKSESLVITQKVITSSSIIAILIISLGYISVVLSDIHTYLTKHTFKKTKKKSFKKVTGSRNITVNLQYQP